MTILFQFHNGTINTSQSGLASVRGETFQFHNGTINTMVKYQNEENLKQVSIPQRYN